MLYSFLEPILLIGAISLDTLIVSILYSYQGIKLPIKSIFTINFICTLCLLISFIFSNFFTTYINEEIINYISFIILFSLGIIKLFDSFIKNLINKHTINKSKSFKVFNLNFIIQVYGDSIKADNDLSKSISIKEAIILALSLSIDSLSVGFGYGLSNLNYKIIILVFFVGIILSFVGKIIGSLINSKNNYDISWISGIMLILLAFFKL